MTEVMDARAPLPRRLAEAELADDFQEEGGDPRLSVTPASEIDKERRGGGGGHPSQTALTQINPKLRRRRGGVGYQASFFELGLADKQHAPFEVNVCQRQSQSFTDPKAGRVEQADENGYDDRSQAPAWTHPPGRGHDLLHFLPGVDIWRRKGAAR